MGKNELEAVIRECSRFALRIGINPWYPQGECEPARYYINVYGRGFESCKAKFWFTDQDLKIQIDYRNNGALSLRQSHAINQVQSVMYRHLVPRKLWEPPTGRSG